MANKVLTLQIAKEDVATFWEMFGGFMREELAGLDGNTCSLTRNEGDNSRVETEDRILQIARWLTLYRKLKNQATGIDGQ